MRPLRLSIVRRFVELCALLPLLFAASALQAQTLGPGSYASWAATGCPDNGTCTWTSTASPPIVFTGNITIPATAIVNVSSGTSVRFSPGTNPARPFAGDPALNAPTPALPVLSLIVLGQLNADGTSFTSSRSFEGLGSNTPGDWGGIVFQGASSGTILNSNIRNATHGLWHNSTASVIYTGGSISDNRHDLGLAAPCVGDAFGAGVFKDGTGLLTITGTSIDNNIVMSCVTPDPYGSPAAPRALDKAYGAGLAATEGNIVLDNVTFTSNRVAANNQPFGGAIGLRASTFKSATVSIKNTKFFDNRVLGGMGFCGDASPSCSSNLWLFPHAAGGAGLAVSRMKVVLEGGELRGNEVHAGTRHDCGQANYYGSYDNVTKDDDQAYPGTATPQAGSPAAPSLGGAILITDDSDVVVDGTYVHLSVVTTRRLNDAKTTSMEQYWCAGGGIGVRHAAGDAEEQLDHRQRRRRGLCQRPDPGAERDLRPARARASHRRQRRAPRNRARGHHYRRQQQLHAERRQVLRRQRHVRAHGWADRRPQQHLLG